MSVCEFLSLSLLAIINREFQKLQRQRYQVKRYSESERLRNCDSKLPFYPLNAQLNACHFCDLLVSYVCLGKRIYDTETQGGITRESEKASRNIWTCEPKNKKGPTCYGRSDRIPSGENSIPDMTGGNDFFLLSSSHSNEALLVRRARAKRVFSISCDSTNKLTFPASVQSLLLFARKLNNL